MSSAGILTLLLSLVAFAKFGDATVDTWTKPVIDSPSGAGTLSLAEDQPLATSIEAYVAVVDGSSSLGDYELVTTGTPFAVSTGGELTITSALDYETTPKYVIEIRAQDDGTPAISGTATITVTITDANDAPVMSDASAVVADGAVATTEVVTMTATDQDTADIITYSIDSGDSDGDFSIGASTGIVTVSTGTTLAASTTPGYALVIHASDDDTTSKTGTATLYVAVASCSGSGAAAVFAGTMLVILGALLAFLK